MRKVIIFLVLIGIKLFATEYLGWQNISFIEKKQFTWSEANSYCKTLTNQNKNWRLPTFKELQASNYQQNIVKNDYYWSQTSNIEDKEEALVYNLFEKLSCEGVKNSDYYYVLCVTQD